MQRIVQLLNCVYKLQKISYYRQKLFSSSIGMNV